MANSNVEDITQFPEAVLTDEVDNKDAAQEDSKDDLTLTPHTAFDAIDAKVFAEPVTTSTSVLTWDEINFKDDEEKKGAMKLADVLQNTHKLKTIPPFEAARFYIGSKSRVEKASTKWMNMMTLCDAHKLQSITELQMIGCFRELSQCVRFGGKDTLGRSILVMNYTVWFPAKFDNIHVLVKCFLIILNIMSQDLECSRTGIVFIANCKDIGWNNFSIKMEEVFTKLVGEAYPLRLAGMYMLDAPFIINVLVKLCKPFMSKKMQERINIISTESMFKVIPKEQVPDSIVGGVYEDQTLSPMYEKCIRYMRDYRVDHLVPAPNKEEK